ncbi:unnamed protein product [Allacma fusca]|uniref:Uncharacterized protein n=1 Tax=Allacma fusca TaxID=39272 RepID=A0A8J2J4Y8_9HEXA|nr:unnamed protein product [Allacma fusca]
MVIHAQSIAGELPCEAMSSVDRLYKTHEALKGLSSSTAGLGFGLLGRAEAYYPDYIEGLEVMEMMLNSNMYLSQGISIITGGTNNQQKFTFNVDKNIFGSEEISSNLGPSVLKELQDLIEGMVTTCTGHYGLRTNCKLRILSSYLPAYCAQDTDNAPNDEKSESLVKKIEPYRYGSYKANTKLASIWPNVPMGLKDSFII